MRTNIHAAVLAAMVIAAPSFGFGQQFTNPGAGGWWHTVNAGTNPQLTRGVSIGNVGAGPYPSVFNIRGELLPAANQTPEVFRTTAPTTGNTFWRMFQGGTGAGNERGQLFAEPGNSHFNINAPNGHFQLHTQDVQRARLNGNVTGPIGPTPGFQFPNINRDGFFLLSGTANAFTNGLSNAPFTRLHLVDNVVSPNDPVVYAQQHGFRPWQRNGITFTGNSDQSYIGHRYAGEQQHGFRDPMERQPEWQPVGNQSSEIRVANDRHAELSTRHTLYEFFAYIHHHEFAA